MNNLFLNIEKSKIPKETNLRPECQDIERLKVSCGEEQELRNLLRKEITDKKIFEG